MPTTMLRPRASAAKDSALAAESTWASLRITIGTSTAATGTIATRTRGRISGEIHCTGEARRRKAKVSAPIVPRRGAAGSDPITSRTRRGSTAEQPRGHEHQHEHQDRENDDVDPPHLENLAAQRLDQADQDAADHGPGDAADAAEHGGGEGSKAGAVADDEARVVVIEAENERRRTGQRRAEKKRG